MKLKTKIVFIFKKSLQRIGISNDIQERDRRISRNSNDQKTSFVLLTLLNSLGNGL